MSVGLPSGLRAINSPTGLYRYEEAGTPQQWPGHVDFHVTPHLDGVEIAVFGVFPRVPVEVLRWIADLATKMRKVVGNETP